MPGWAEIPDPDRDEELDRMDRINEKADRDHRRSMNTIGSLTRAREAADAIDGPVFDTEAALRLCAQARDLTKYLREMGVGGRGPHQAFSLGGVGRQCEIMEGAITGAAIALGVWLEDELPDLAAATEDWSGQVELRRADS